MRGEYDGRITRPLRHNGLNPIQGINTLLLWSEAVARGFVSPTWMTFKQSVELGGHVRKGETGIDGRLCQPLHQAQKPTRGERSRARHSPFLKAYTVFCTEQIDDLPAQYYGNPAAGGRSCRAHRACRCASSPIPGAVIRHSGSTRRSTQSRALDIVQMPPFESFRDAPSYYATLGHEMTHWVGSEKRLDRNLSRYHKDRSFRAHEELVADLGGCFLAADLGIVPELEPRPDHASYLASWLEILKNEKRFIFAAAAHAQRAVNYLHDLQPGATQVAEAA
jgi:antirestriction protein ArdC